MPSIIEMPSKSQEGNSGPGAKIESFKGLIPESWLCVDCGVNTAPGFFNRAEMEEAFRQRRVLQGLGLAVGDGVEQTFTPQSEIYTVRDKVWKAAGMKPWDGCLCIGCLEQRLGRRLKPKDFQPGNGLNLPHIPGTARLLQRRGRRY